MIQQLRHKVMANKKCIRPMNGNNALQCVIEYKRRDKVGKTESKHITTDNRTGKGQCKYVKEQITQLNSKDFPRLSLSLSLSPSIFLPSFSPNHSVYMFQPEVGCRRYAFKEAIVVGVHILSTTKRGTQRS